MFAFFPALKRFFISANYENENDSFVDNRFLSEVELSRDLVCPSVGWLVGRSVCHYLLREREVSLNCSDESTCYLKTHS